MQLLLQVVQLLSGWMCRFNMDAAWSETGDRYLLKLFRDYLFHQVDANGAPWLDMAHIVQCLNKVKIKRQLKLQ